MAPARELASLRQVAVGQQPRIGGPVGLHAHGEAREHVRAVGPVGDAAEPLRLALGAEPAGRHVEAFEIGVGLGVDHHLGFEDEAVRQVWNGQGLVGDLVLVGADLLAVDDHALELQPHAVEHQGIADGAGAANLHARLHPRGVGLQGEVELDLVDHEGGRPVVGQVDRLGNIGAHAVLYRRPAHPPTLAVG